MSISCRSCDVVLPDDAPSPFCYPCWNAALTSKDHSAAISILRWIAEPPTN
jgi:hypothetical protein